MDEKTVFESQTPASNVPDPIPPAPPAPAPPAPPPIEPDYSDDDGGSRLPSFHISTIIKIAVGLFVVALIFLAFFALILPLFSKKAPGKAELVYWGLWEDRNIVQPIIDDFNKKYPDIKVTYARKDIRQYREKLSTQIANNIGPDIFIFHNSWYPMFSKILLPLSDDVIKKDEFKKSFYPVAQNDLVKNGGIYGIPTSMDTLALYANTDLFKAGGFKVPDNWEDFISVAGSLTVVDETGKIKTSGASLGTYNNVAHSSDIISMLFAQNGANMNDLESTQKAASEALTFYTSFSSGEQRVWDNTLDNSKQAFKEGRVAMYFGYSWDYFDIKSNNPDLNIEIHPVPKIKDNNTSIASYWAAGISSKSKFPSEASLFLKFLTSEESQEKMYSLESKTRLFGELYPRKNLAEKLKGTVAYPFVSQAEKAVSTFFASDTYDDGLNSQANKYLENAVNSMQPGNDSSADTAIENLSKGVSQVLNQYGQ